MVSGLISHLDRFSGVGKEPRTENITILKTTSAGRIAQLEPQMERMEQRGEELRAELQASQHNNTSLSQQVAEMDAAAAMHLAHQVSTFMGHGLTLERKEKKVSAARHHARRL